MRLTWLNLRVKATTFGAELCFSFLFQPQLDSSWKHRNNQWGGHYPLNHSSSKWAPLSEETATNADEEQERKERLHAESSVQLQMNGCPSNNWSNYAAWSTPLTSQTCWSCARTSTLMPFLLELRNQPLNYIRWINCLKLYVRSFFLRFCVFNYWTTFLTVDFLSCHGKKTKGVTINDDSCPLSHRLEHLHLRVMQHSQNVLSVPEKER